MSKHNNKKLSGTTKLIIVLLMLICVFSTILFIKIKADEHRDNKEQEQISQVIDIIDIPKEHITPELPERVLKVRELQKENAEVVGWLEIDGTNISYPVCQAQDNDYYLTHTYKKENF